MGRLLDFFIIFNEFDYTEAHIARKTHLTPKTVSKELEILLNEGIIKITRKMGNSNMYRLHKESEKVRGLVQYTEDTIKMGYESLGKTS